MTMNRLIAMTLGATLLSGVALGATAAKPVAAPMVVKSIELPTITTELPPGPGRDTVAVSCILCHSPRYITGQPPFKRAVWVAEVDKMRKVYGAPIEEAQVAEIVDYLVAIRGAQEPAGK
jgi:mono/diheme cytochrome c family protein